METGFITPIQMADSLESLRASQSVQGTEQGVFKSILEGMINNVKETEANHEQQEYLLATGQIDDAHTVTIAAAEAQLAVDMLVQLRNKAVDAYNEIIRITV